jgi:hypothetical protein
MAKVQTYNDWIESDKDKVHEALFALVSDYENNVNKTISTGNLKNTAQYLGSGVGSIDGFGYMSDIDMSQQLGSNSTTPRVNINLTAALIDTLTAKLASLTILPKAITNRSNAKGRQQAEDLNDLIKGLMNKYSIHHHLTLAMRDAMINRVGYIKIVKDKKNSEVKVERLYANEIIIDPSDGFYNKPYKMVHKKLIPINVAVKLFPKFKEEIEGAHVIEVRRGMDTTNYTPSIMILEAWCKNTYLKKGRHVIAIENVTLLDEPYEKDYFPVVKIDYNEPVVGWLGQSAVDELAPLQREVDRIVATQQAIMKLVSIPRVFYDINSQMKPEHMTNKVGIMIGMDLKNGVAPIIHNGSAMPPELGQQLEFLITQMYQRVGLTPMDTQGQAPMGLESGEALRTMGDIKSERWQMLRQTFELQHIELIKILLQELTEIDFKINTLDKIIGLRQLSTSIIPKDFDSFVLQIVPTSSLPSDPAGRIDTIERFVANGFIDKEYAADLLQMPDLESQIAMSSAPRKFVEMSIEDMLENGEYVAPEPYDPLDFAMTCALRHYSWERMNDKDETKLKLLRRYINDCRKLIQQIQTPAVPQEPVAPAPKQ